MTGFGDQHTAFTAYYAFGFGEGKLDNPGIDLKALSPGTRASSGPDALQVDQLTFCFGDNLVFDNQNVTAKRPDPGALHLVEQHGAKRVPRPNLIAKAHWHHAQFRTCLIH